MATWRVDAGRLHGVATAVTATTGESARRAGKRDVWTAMEHIPQDRKNVMDQLSYNLHNESTQATDTTTEHHENTRSNGGTDK